MCHRQRSSERWLLGANDALGQESPDSADDGESRRQGHDGVAADLLPGGNFVAKELDVKCYGEAGWGVGQL